MPKHTNDCLQGTLDLLILKILARSGPLHGYALAQRIHQITDESLRIEEGSLYPALQRGAREKWLAVPGLARVHDEDREMRRLETGIDLVRALHAVQEQGGGDQQEE